MEGFSPAIPKDLSRADVTPSSRTQQVVLISLVAFSPAPLPAVPITMAQARSQLGPTAQWTINELIQTDDGLIVAQAIRDRRAWGSATDPSKTVVALQRRSLKVPLKPRDESWA
jgi:hypothetical protein